MQIADENYSIFCTHTFKTFFSALISLDVTYFANKQRDMWCDLTYACEAKQGSYSFNTWSLTKSMKKCKDCFGIGLI